MNAAPRPDGRGPATPALAGRRALVTGATAGLGFAIADRLAAGGCAIVLHGLEPDDAGIAACGRLASAHGVAARYVRADLSTEAGAVALHAAADADGEGIDVLVNNAVVRHFAPIDAFPVAAWDRALAVNVSAAFHLVRLALPAMRRRHWGRIVNLSSIYGSRGTVNRIDYVTTKSALLGFTRAVAMETLTDGITCNAVCPGSVLTPSIDARVAALAQDRGLARADAERQFLAGKQPSGAFIEADHVAELIAFLCGPAGRDITGSVLPIDGGWLAG